MCTNDKLMILIYYIMNIPLLFLYNWIHSFYWKLYIIKHNKLQMKSYHVQWKFFWYINQRYYFADYSIKVIMIIELKSRHQTRKKIFRELENCLLQASSPFLRMFLCFLVFIFHLHILSHVICNLDQFNCWLSVYELMCVN